MPARRPDALRALLVAGLVMSSLTVPARADETRQQLARERVALEQRFADEERACAARFAVHACVDEVRARRRAALAPLRDQELRLEDAERRRRAEERRAAVARKQAEAAQRPPLPPEASLPPREPAAPASSPPVVETLPPRAQGPSAQEAAEAARRAEGLQQARERADAAEARIRQRRERQQAELAAKGRQPDTLPRPAGPASAASAARR